MARKNDRRGVPRVAKNMRFRKDLADRVQSSADTKGSSWNAELQRLVAVGLWFEGDRTEEVSDAR